MANTKPDVKGPTYLYLPVPAALWSGTNKNQDVSTGPLARPFARTAHSFTRSLTLLTPSLEVKWMIWCLKMTWFCPIVSWLLWVQNKRRRLSSGEIIIAKRIPQLLLISLRPFFEPHYSFLIHLIPSPIFWMWLAEELKWSCYVHVWFMSRLIHRNLSIAHPLVRKSRRCGTQFLVVL